MKAILIGLYLVVFSSCKETASGEIKSSGVVPEALKPYQAIGFIERLSEEINTIIPPDAEIEVLADGLVWAEGPLWVDELKCLLLSDVKENKVYKWTEDEGLRPYLEPSGFTGEFTDSRERGSNGLTLDSQGRLVLCQHGDRQVARMTAPLTAPRAQFEVIADRYQGWKFNSPNDLVFHSNGDLYFTDPPYGLSEKLLDDPNKELPFQGVFKVDSQGEVTLLTDQVSRPNGLAFSPDEKTLYVANTDAKNARWLAFEVGENGTLGSMEEILNVTRLIGSETGFPDGIKVDRKGNIFTAGPGGLWIFNKRKELIGKIKPGKWVSNCAFDDTYETLYITAADYLLRVKLIK